MAPFWAPSRSFICLGECIDCPHIIVPYSNFKQIKYLYICQLGLDACQWSRWSNYMLVCFFFSYVFNMGREGGGGEIKFLIYNSSQYSLWRDFSKVVTMNCNWYLYRWSFALFIIEHYITDFHWGNKNMLFWTQVPKVYYCNLNAYQ